jgi:hypothetical protein
MKILNANEFPKIKKEYWFFELDYWFWNLLIILLPFLLQSNVCKIIMKIIWYYEEKKSFQLKTIIIISKNLKSFSLFNHPLELPISHEFVKKIFWKLEIIFES